MPMRLTEPGRTELMIEVCFNLLGTSMYEYSNSSSIKLYGLVFLLQLSEFSVSCEESSLKLYSLGTE